MGFVSSLLCCSDEDSQSSSPLQTNHQQLQHQKEKQLQSQKNNNKIIQNEKRTQTSHQDKKNRQTSSSSSISAETKQLTKSSSHPKHRKHNNNSYDNHSMTIVTPTLTINTNTNDAHGSTSINGMHTGNTKIKDNNSNDSSKIKNSDNGQNQMKEDKRRRKKRNTPNNQNIIKKSLEEESVTGKEYPNAKDEEIEEKESFRDKEIEEEEDSKETQLVNVYNSETDTSTGETVPQTMNEVLPSTQEELENGDDINITTNNNNNDDANNDNINNNNSNNIALERNYSAETANTSIGSTTTNSMTTTSYDEDNGEFIDLTLLQPMQYHADGYKTLLSPKDEIKFKHKKCLVLDLDETLVHSSFKYLPNADFNLPVNIDDQIHNVYVIKRPGVDEFLEKVGKLFEVVIFTASVSRYGDPLLDRLDPKGKSIHHRLFREACYNYEGNYIKNLSQMGRPLSEIIILDNSPASYIFHPQHAIPISSWFSDSHDNELLDIIPLLEDLSKNPSLDVGKVLDVTI
ncbi:dullard-like phosphatase domain-containing protein NDAI_0D01860 [Naumovozyma dairenensis CBS 421]|uniref:FCP1 homology domain-containing protein n=1 Tax=Naumovozyma dairenensis (strain ATCC 10597 / BCRC 20456 / CBS 421 / NBRC 0211 / NRRL Y-12639) TaxID=1071378 RepID=G0W9N9_NAUDC|nr:hypothetical protein NDAI_0D01860 [Naumovozyma dairenensis CBS 421]CCD24500.1 hypothetical protein NDAI_0D01860 [Naumovozyma dairenensis CBS 421]